MNHFILEKIPLLFVTLFISLGTANPAQGQAIDTITSIAKVEEQDIVKDVSTPAEMFSEIAQSLVREKQFLSLSYTNRKVSYHIPKEGKLFPVPGGHSRAVLFELPGYVNDYILTIKSMVHGFGFTYHIFAPTGVFLDSSFKPIRFLGEKNFKLVQASTFTILHVKTDVTVDSYRKDSKYLLIYTLDTDEQLGVYNDRSQGLLISLLKHPVERSPDGNLQLALHVR